MVGAVNNRWCAALGLRRGGIMQCDRIRVRRLLLTTSSALALIAGLNAGAEAACTPIVMLMIAMIVQFIFIVVMIVRM